MSVSDKQGFTLSVEFDHLETMGLLMALSTEEERDGLSSPQVEAKKKLEALWAEHWKRLREDG